MHEKAEAPKEPQVDSANAVDAGAGEEDEQWEASKVAQQSSGQGISRERGYYGRKPKKR